MSKPVQTYIFCLDDHRTLSEEVRKRFSDATRYIINISHNRDDLMKSVVNVKDQVLCKVVIIGLNETNESFLMAENLVGEIKKTDIRTGIIILAPAEKIDEVKKTVRVNIDSYIPRNANTILRIHNTVKKHISQNNLLIYRKRKTISIYALVSFIILSIVFAIIAWLKLPMYF